MHARATLFAVAVTLLAAGMHARACFFLLLLL
jgi:hypothetical protein